MRLKDKVPRYYLLYYYLNALSLSTQVRIPLHAPFHLWRIIEIPSTFIDKTHGPTCNRYVTAIDKGRDDDNYV